MLFENSENRAESASRRQPDVKRPEKEILISALKMRREAARIFNAPIFNILSSCRSRS